jgi:hypothetical protein
MFHALVSTYFTVAVSMFWQFQKILSSLAPFTTSHHFYFSGAVFILYNCARLAALLRQFEEKVQLGYYPQLIPYEAVDFLLLSKEVSYMDLILQPYV